MSATLRMSGIRVISGSGGPLKGTFNVNYPHSLQELKDSSNRSHQYFKRVFSSFVSSCEASCGSCIKYLTLNCCGWRAGAPIRASTLRDTTRWMKRYTSRSSCIYLSANALRYALNMTAGTLWATLTNFTCLHNVIKVMMPKSNIAAFDIELTVQIERICTRFISLKISEYSWCSKHQGNCVLAISVNSVV
jgi:hypothetical protein